MAIKGMTGHDNQVRFPRIGKLRKGAASPSGGGIGKELPYFRFVGEIPGATERFEELYGPGPAALTVYLPYATVEENFSTWREEWVAGGLKHRCDGETCTIWLKPDGTYSREPRQCPGGCKQVGRLSVILPDMIEAGYVGQATAETHSINDLVSIDALLRFVAEGRRHNPMGLRGVQFVLRRVQEEISTPGKNGNRTRRPKWLMKLEPAADWMAAQLALQAAAEERERLALAGPARAAIPARTQTMNGRTVDTQTGEVIDADPPEEDDEVIEGEISEPEADEGAEGAEGVPTCPKCGGEMWDNRPRKAEGKMKPNAPDYKCKDKDCGGLYWPGQWKGAAEPDVGSNGSSGNGRGAAKTIKLTDDQGTRDLFKELAAELATKQPEFAKENGDADVVAIGAAMYKAGIRNVDASNVMEAFDALYKAPEPDEVPW